MILRQIVEFEQDFAYLPDYKAALRAEKNKRTSERSILFSTTLANQKKKQFDFPSYLWAGYFLEKYDTYYGSKSSNVIKNKEEGKNCRHLVRFSSL